MDVIQIVLIILTMAGIFPARPPKSVLKTDSCFYQITSLSRPIFSDLILTHHFKGYAKNWTQSFWSNYSNAK